ncbi:MAG TPA: FGGY-family carbohydrate kinase [Acidimicrobiales bacterium]|nr:FGGY-family carbohydrate kinase [Acidimicrobiales bacterium]
MSVLVVDVGSSAVRAAVVRADGTVEHLHQRHLSDLRPSPGVAEFDPSALAQAAVGVASASLEAGGPVRAVGITAQRASTIVWERSTGQPVAPGISWQDLRTSGRCLALSARGVRLTPNQSATKLAYLLDLLDADRSRDLCFGTVECYLAWVLSRGAAHVTDASNAGVTGLILDDASDWDDHVLEELRVSRATLPRIVDSTGIIAPASALPGGPPIAGLVGDQQASLIGQARLAPGEAKATFGTGGMLDCVTAARPAFSARGDRGTFPIVAWREAGRVTWGIEAIMLSAGSCIEWLRAGLGLIGDAAESDEIAGSIPDAGGVIFVPALGGLGTPLWDFGARGTFVGLSASTSRAELVRAVLEGIAHRSADLLEAAEADGDVAVATLRVDGGMTANATFLQLLADALGRPIAPALFRDATTLGAAYLAGTATGVWSSLAEAAATARHGPVVEPARRLDRERWLDARERALRTVPAMSAISF